jgi:hypothetical protein
LSHTLSAQCHTHHLASNVVPEEQRASFFFAACIAAFMPDLLNSTPPSFLKKLFRSLLGRHMSCLKMAGCSLNAFRRLQVSQAQNLKPTAKPSQPPLPSMSQMAIAQSLKPAGPAAQSKQGDADSQSCMCTFIV